MAKVSISEAARLAKISRAHFYKKWITPGLISVEKDGSNSPVIDTSELLRVFGELKGDSQQAASSNDPAMAAELEILRRVLAERDAQLRNAEEREEWLRKHIVEITGALRRLEYKPQSDQLEHQQGQLQKARRVISQYKQAMDDLEAERSKGFWARLFN